MRGMLVRIAKGYSGTRAESRRQHAEALLRSRFAPMIDPQHYKAPAIEAILKHVSRAEHLQYQLTIFFPAGDRAPE
jgi:hypothetical protein